MAELLLRALAEVWKALAPLQVPVALMGGLAVAVWKHVRATRDVDLLIGLDTGQVDELLRQLAGASIRPKRDPPVLTLGSLHIVQLLYEPPDAYWPVQVDLLLAESDYHREA